MALSKEELGRHQSDEKRLDDLVNLHARLDDLTWVVRRAWPVIAVAGLRELEDQLMVWSAQIAQRATDVARQMQTRLRAHV